MHPNATNSSSAVFPAAFAIGFVRSHRTPLAPGRRGMTFARLSTARLTARRSSRPRQDVSHVGMSSPDEF